MPIVHALNGEFDPIIINPAHAGNSKKKADKFDAGLLAYHGLTGIWEKSFIPSDIQHDLTIVNRRFMKAKQGITKATNAIGSRLIDYNNLLPREIQVYSSSGKSILQAITYDDGSILTGIDIIDLLKTIQGVGSRYGEVLISETGIDIVKRFENAPALQSFAGFDPSKTYSADKVRSKKSKKGNKHIHTVTIQIGQAMLQHGKKDNPLAKWGRLYKMRMGGTAAAHNQAIAAVGKRIINISYHIIRTGKPYDGNRYNFNAHQTKMEKRLKQVATRVQDLANEIHASEIDESARVIATEAIHALSSIAGVGKLHPEFWCTR